MSDGINTVMLLGYLGADAEVKQTAKGDPLVKMRLATTRSWMKENNEKEERTDWHNLVYFKRGESLAKHLTKGTRIFVQGRIETSSYEKDGQKRYSTDIVVDELTFAGSSRASASASPSMSSVAANDFPPPRMAKAGKGLNGREGSKDRGGLSDLPF